MVSVHSGSVPAIQQFNHNIRHLENANKFQQDPKHTSVTNPQKFSSHTRRHSPLSHFWEHRSPRLRPAPTSTVAAPALGVPTLLLIVESANAPTGGKAPQQITPKPPKSASLHAAPHRVGPRAGCQLLVVSRGWGSCRVWARQRLRCARL